MLECDKGTDQLSRSWNVTVGLSLCHIPPRNLHVVILTKVEDRIHSTKPLPPLEVVFSTIVHCHREKR